MAWGPSEEEAHALCKTELALLRVPLYRLAQNVNKVVHPEKGERLRALMTEVYRVLDMIEMELRH